MANKRIITWCYFCVAICILVLALFTALIDPKDASIGGGKGVFIVAIASFIGAFIKPVFGFYSTSMVFVVSSLPFLYIWQKRLKG